MKIAIVCARLCLGGAEHVGTMLANGFDKFGHKTYLISNTNLDISYSINKSVILEGIFPVTNNKLKKWGYAIYNLRKLIKVERPDVVIGIAETCSFVSLLACINLNVPVIYTAHNSFERPKNVRMGIWNYFAKFWLVHLYSHVTVLTNTDLSIIGINRKNISVMPNPLELKPVDEIPLKEKIVFAAGRLDGWYVKGFDILINAWGMIFGDNKMTINTGMNYNSIISSSDNSNIYNYKNKEWKLCVAGTGSEDSINYLKQLCKENGVEESVELVGFQNNIEEYYRKSSIFVLSSRYEGFGLVLIEAMSQGCACIACDYKGRQRDIIKDFSEGLICIPDDIISLSKALKKMMFDNNYRESIRKNAVERSKCFSIDNTICRWEKLLNTLK